MTPDSLGILAIHGMTLGDPSVKSIDMDDLGVGMNSAATDSNRTDHDKMIEAGKDVLKSTGVETDGDVNKLDCAITIHLIFNVFALLNGDHWLYMACISISLLLGIVVYT